MTMMICKCERCQHEWATHKERWNRKGETGFPWQCPKCKSAKWRIPKRPINIRRIG